MAQCDGFRYLDQRRCALSNVSRGHGRFCFCGGGGGLFVWGCLFRLLLCWAGVVFFVLAACWLLEMVCPKSLQIASQGGIIPN